MAAIYTTDAVLQVNDYYSKVIRAKKYGNPIQTIIKRGDKPEQWKQEIEVEGATGAYSLGAPEGADFDETTLAKRTNKYLEVQLEKFRTKRGYKVTDESELLPGYTEKKGEKALARQIRRDAEELVRSIEVTLGSAQEAVPRGSGDEDVAKTRGMMCWLAKLTKPTSAGTYDSVQAAIDAAVAALHGVQPIPEEFCPQCGITGDITSAAVFKESIFKAELLKAALEQGDGHLQLTGLVGLQLKALMSNWLGKSETVSGMDTVLRRNETKGRKIELICDEFSYDSVSVRTIVCNHLGCTIGNAGDAVTMGTAQQYNGAFIRPEFWSIDTLLPMRIRKLENRGGGERGYHEAILRLACRNPLSQFAVTYSV